jgi:hypothetical protein
MRSLICLAWAFLVFSCSEEESHSAAPPAPDTVFRVGEFDDYDFHQSFDPPLEIVYDRSQPSTYELNFEGDSSPELGFRGYYSGSSGGLSTYKIFAFPLEENSSWQMAFQTHRDSVYLCADTVPWTWLGTGGGVLPVYYSLNTSFNCPQLVDSFYRLDYHKVPQRMSRGQDPRANWQWSNWNNHDPNKAVYFDRYDYTHSMGRYMNSLELNFYQGFTTTHFLLFRKREGTDFRYAWLKLQFHRAEGKFRIEEMAFQAAGRS